MAQPTTYDAVIATPIGRIGVLLHRGALDEISFLPPGFPLAPPAAGNAQRVCSRLREYFRNPGVSLDLPLAPRGTPYQRRVWRALQRIPPGRTVSYGGLARRLKTSARAVGNACRANPVPLVVPCHRVVAADGAGGFMGKRSGRALKLKRWLLAHESGR